MIYVCNMGSIKFFAVLDYFYCVYIEENVGWAAGRACGL